MSDVSPEAIIAEHGLSSWSLVSMPGRHEVRAVCLCGHEEVAPKSKSEFLIPPQARRILAGHQVERLRHHGHTIVPSDGIVRTYRAASTLGQKYMLPTTFGCDREEAERWFELHQSALAGLPGVDTVQLEYRDELDSDWEPLAAAASPTAPAQEES